MHACSLCGDKIFVQRVSGHRITLNSELHTVPTVKDGYICEACFEDSNSDLEVTSKCSLCKTSYVRYSEMYPPEIGSRCHHLFKGGRLLDQIELDERNYLVLDKNQLDVRSGETVCETCIEDLVSQEILREI
mgnify:CR=1 FL=1